MPMHESIVSHYEAATKRGVESCISGLTAVALQLQVNHPNARADLVGDGARQTEIVIKE